MRSALPWCYNARAVVPVTERAQNLAQIEKLLSSHTLHGSESLCKLLRYLANHSLDHPGLSPKEYQIATEVFGRQKDFDPHLDSMVRVQAGRNYANVSHEAPNHLEVNGRTSRNWIVAVIALSVVLASVVAVATDRFLNRR